MTCGVSACSRAYRLVVSASLANWALRLGTRSANVMASRGLEKQKTGARDMPSLTALKRRPPHASNALQPREQLATSVGSTVASGATNSALVFSDPWILSGPASPTGTRRKPAKFSMVTLGSSAKSE